VRDRRGVTRSCFYAVVGMKTERTVEVFADREQAEAFIAEVEGDEPETAAGLRVESFDFGAPLN
jgi:hypothetical protein